MNPPGAICYGRSSRLLAWRPGAIWREPMRAASLAPSAASMNRIEKDGTSCYNGQDCRPVRARTDDDGYWEILAAAETRRSAYVDRMSENTTKAPGYTNPKMSIHNGRHQVRYKPMEEPR